VTDLTVVIPCYNEAASLPTLFAAMARSISDDVAMDVIVVDNGSTDDTPRVLAELVAAHGFVSSVRVPANQGYGHGIVTGLRRAAGRVVGWTHADLQTDPADVVSGYRAFREPLLAGRTVVKGRRIGRPLVDRLCTAGMSAVASLALSGRFADINAQPKLFPRELLERMQNAPDDFSLDLYLLWLARRNGYALAEFPVRFRPREHGEAKGGGSLRLKWRLTRRTLSYTLALRRRVAGGK